LKIKPPFTPKELQNFAEQLIEQNHMPEAILRVTLTRGPGERGYTPPAGSRPAVVMTLHAVPEVPPQGDRGAAPAPGLRSGLNPEA